MKQIRHNVFETNSSSTHSITICKRSLYQMFNNGEAYFDRERKELIECSKALPEGLITSEYGYKRYLTEAEFYSKIESGTAEKGFIDSNGGRECSICVYDVLSLKKGYK